MDLDYLPPLGRPSESYLNVLDAIAEGLTLDEDMIADVARGVVAESATRTVTASRDMTLEVGDGHVLIAADDVEVTMFSPEGNDGAECRIISGPYTGTSVVGDIAGQRSVAFGARSCVTLRSNDTSWDIV